jgi:serine/threonine protein kinase/sugar lactone lactonase YvrE
VSTPACCPAADSWEALFAADLVPEQREAYEHHLESCPLCQARLDRFEELEGVFQKLGQEFGDPTLTPIDPTLAEFLGHLREVRSAVRPTSADAPDLYFLRPSDRPGLLGRLGDYEVREVIGQGGMGVVLKAFEPALHRFVAIKVMAPPLAGSAMARRRFTREAQAAAAVCHDHVVTVHGVHEAERLPYLVMQYVAGESLQARLDRVGPLDVMEVVRIGMQTAAGLAAAHAQGLIHRDIKPANLLLENGLARVKISDFGLARMVDDVALTQSGVVAGTPEYMAPEQARGEPVDHRADLFSLGSVMYAMCTGRPPFRGTTAVAVLRRVSDEEPPSLRSLNPEVPAWLEAVVVRLMAKDPGARVQSAAEVAILLEGYLAHLRQPDTLPAPQLLLSPSIPTCQAEIAPTRSCASRLWSIARYAALAAAVVLAALGLVAPHLEKGGQQPDRDRPAPAPAGPDTDVWSVVVSQDGKVVAAGAGMWDKPGEIGVWDLATREPLQRFAEDLGVASVALSPDGKLLAAGSWTGWVRVYDWSAGQLVHELPVLGVARVAFSPDGRLLATATEDKTVQLWDVAKGQMAADLEGDLFRFHCVAFSPDGRRVLAGGGDWKAGGINQVTVWDVADRKQVQALTGHQSAVLVIAYSPDGKTLATGSVDNTVRLWDADSGKPLKTLPAGTWVEGLVFSPDGKTLVSGGRDRMLHFWDVATGREKQPVTLPGTVRTLRFTPDGAALLVGGGGKALKFYAAADHQELAALWNGSVPQTLPMDLFPVTSPTARVPEKGSLAALGLLALGLGSFMSLSFAVWLSVRQRRTAPAAGEPGPLVFPCVGCGKKLRVKAALAGRKVKCPGCGQATSAPECARAETVPVSGRSWWRQAGALAGLAVSVLLAALLAVGLWLSRRDPPPPPVSRLQMAADRVRAKKADSIDARPFASVGDRDLAALRGLTNLRSLNLDHTEVTDEGMQDVAGLTGLVSLSLTNTQVTDAGLAKLKSLAGMDDLRLDKLPITDAGLAHVTAFSKLRKLSLYQTRITDDGLAYLKPLPLLERVSLDETGIGDEGLRHLAQCPGLKYVSVWHTRVSPAGIQELRKALPGLQVNK